MSEPSARMSRLADLARTAWPTVRVFLGCECTDFDPAVCTGIPEGAGRAQCAPAPGYQCSCHHIRTEDEHASIRAAVEQRAFDAPKVLREFAETAGRSPHPDAPVWAEALRWAASRIRGGHASIHADEEFGQRFGVHPYRTEWADQQPE